MTDTSSEAPAGCPVTHFDHMDQGLTELSLRSTYRELLADRVTWSDAHGGFWILSGFGDIRDAELRPGEFSCGLGGIVHPNPRPEFRGLALEQDPPDNQPYRGIFLSWMRRGGQTLRRGDHVMLLFGAANLDSNQFDDPLRFDIDRANVTRHLSYGHGTHRCAGASLADMELSALTSALLRHEFRLAGPVTYGAPGGIGSTLGFSDIPLSVLKATHGSDG